ncbi:MAG: alpha-1,2-fucosyltransferase, partial [Gammaproteobacteria bacterium]
IAHINNEVQNAFFILFSDDSDWVKNHLAKNLLPNDNYIVIDHNKGDGSYNDMRLMSLCSHNIIANSSFSWWGAWLNQHKEKIVIAPENWFSTNKNTKDLYPKSWIIL